MRDFVTVVLTSHNRPNELKTTLNSFFKYNTYPIYKIIIIEDSGIPNCIDESIKEIPDNVEKCIIYNEKNIGQSKSIDKAYNLVETEYIFHCEDDWEFYDYGFIEKSFEILKLNEKIFMVHLRGYKNLKIIDNWHPINPIIHNNLFRYLDIYGNEKDGWYGFSFNPGLRRFKDCKAFMPYGEKSGFVEKVLSRIYYENKYLCAITLNEKGYVRHIGFDNPTPRNY
jgi:GT2 family glycosyltransferase